MDQQNAEADSQYQTNSFNNDDSGQYYGDGTKTPGAPYFSPWDIWFNRGANFAGRQPAYIFWNGNADAGEDNAYSPYTLEVTAYVGLAYYDGDNNGTFDDPSLGGGGGASYNLASGNYPTLYDNNQPNGFPQEIGALVRMLPFTINPMTGSRLESDTDHLPIDANNVKFGANFDFPGGLSPDEMHLLKEYGKVFFYEVNIYENGSLIDNATLHPYVETLHTGQGDWQPAETVPGSGMQMQGVAPSLGTNFDLFYYYAGLPNGTDWAPDRNKIDNTCDSREVVFLVPPAFNSHNITGGSVPKTLYMGFTQNPFTFWQNSSLDLRIN